MNEEEKREKLLNDINLFSDVRNYISVLMKYTNISDENIKETMVKAKNRLNEIIKNLRGKMENMEDLEWE